VLPLAGLLMVLAGFVLGLTTSALTGLKDDSRKVYVISSSLANHGFTMGGLICFLLFGEQGLGLASVFIIYFMFYTYIFIFSYAKYQRGDVISLKTILKEYVFSLQNLPMFAAGIALVLNISGVQRPVGFPPFENLIFISVPLYYFSLGLNYSFSKIFYGGRAHIFSAINKFIAVPVLTLLVLTVSGITGDIRAVIMIQSFMPAAIYSIISAVLFNLDVKLAGSLFVVNSVIFMVLILPLLFLFREYFY
jgi:hypothetical protein